jgi:hypothetical protein
MRRWFLPVALLWGAGCGSSAEPIGSCDYRKTGMPAQQYCQEYQASASVIATYRGTCPQGAWGDSACPRQSALGGCRTSEASLGLTVTNWFYQGGPYASAEVVKMSCAADGKSMYVAP